MIITAITATASNQVASAARARNYLGVFNQSTTGTVYIAFGAAAAAAATAGQITLGPLSGTGTIPSSVVWDGSNSQNVPSQAINMIASAGGVPVTLIE